MPKWMRITLGVATATPAAVFLLYAAIFSYGAALDMVIAPGTETGSRFMNRAFPYLCGLIVAMGLLGFGLFIFYLVDVLTSPCLSGTEKALWVMLLWMGSSVAGMVYWYLYIWRDTGALLGAPSPSTSPTDESSA